MLKCIVNCYLSLRVRFQRNKFVVRTYEVCKRLLTLRKTWQTNEINICFIDRPGSSTGNREPSLAN